MRSRSALALTAAVTAATAVGARWYVQRQLDRIVSTPTPAPLGPLPYPEGRLVEVDCSDGTRLHARIIGSGRPDVVLGHGWTADLRTWDLMLDELVAAGRTVVVWDQRGHGRSSVGSDGFGISQLGSDLAAVLVAVDADQAVVVGHSMGGVGVQSLAVDHPELVAERVGRLVLVSSLSRAVPVPGSAAVLAALRSDWFARLRTQVTLGTLGVLKSMGEAPAALQVERARRLFLDCPIDTVAGALEPLLELDLSGRLGVISTPTTLVCGTDDLVTPPELSQAIHTEIAGSQLHLLPGCGHLVPYERPAELVELIVGE